MDDSVNIGVPTAGQDAAVQEMRRIQYKGRVMGQGVCSGPVDPTEFKRAPDKVTCEICGEPVAINAAFHFSATANGEICVRDPLRTLRAGKISRERYNQIVAERSVQPEKPE